MEIYTQGSQNATWWNADLLPIPYSLITDCLVQGDNEAKVKHLTWSPWINVGEQVGAEER